MMQSDCTEIKYELVTQKTYQIFHMHTVMEQEPRHSYIHAKQTGKYKFS